MARILVIDDEPDVAHTIQRSLALKGHEVLTAHGGAEGLRLVWSWKPDLLILDILMPDLNGFEVCKRLRTDQRTADIPIIFLTAKADIQDKIAGFEAGGDDYLTKPFDIQELEMRVRAVLRRVQREPEERPRRLVVGSLTLDCRTYEASTRDRTVVLTPVEFELLYHLMSHPGEVFSSERLLREVWNYPPGTGDPALVRMHIRNLRAKLEPSTKHPIYIRTISRHGYSVRPDEE